MIQMRSTHTWPLCAIFQLSASHIQGYPILERKPPRMVQCRRYIAAPPQNNYIRVQFRATVVATGSMSGQKNRRSAARDPRRLRLTSSERPDFRQRVLELTLYVMTAGIDVCWTYVTFRSFTTALAEQALLLSTILCPFRADAASIYHGF